VNSRRWPTLPYQQRRRLSSRTTASRHLYSVSEQSAGRRRRSSVVLTSDLRPERSIGREHQPRRVHGRQWLADLRFGHAGQRRQRGSHCSIGLRLAARSTLHFWSRCSASIRMRRQSSVGSNHSAPWHSNPSAPGPRHACVHREPSRQWFVLEETESLAPPVIWMPVSPLPPNPSDPVELHLT